MTNSQLLLFSIADYPLFFVVWNLFLAAIPFWISNYFYRKKNCHLGFDFWSLFIVWFFFFPNIPYLFTEVRHLLSFCPPSYYEICWEGAWQIPFFFTYSILGIPLFYLSLKRMGIVLSRFHKKWIHFPLLMIPITAIGLLFGLVERFNSWNVLTHPFHLIETAFGYFMNLEKFIAFFGFTACMYLVYYGLDYLLKRYDSSSLNH